MRLETFWDFVPFFEREIGLLGRPFWDLNFRAIFRVLRSEGTQEADEACRVFAITLEWPPVSEPVRLELCLRLCTARWWCTVVADDPLDEPKREFLESVLIEYWRDVGRRDWIHENFCLTGEERRKLKIPDPDPYP